MPRYAEAGAGVPPGTLRSRGTSSLARSIVAAVPV
jgi:hypothetical protein